MQRIQTRLRLGYGLVLGGGVALGLILAFDAFVGLVLPFPWSLIWLLLCMIPAAGLSIVFLTAVQERKPVQLEEAE
ncbi:hypothetical protein [Hyphobacterium sp.]|jgi:hypothetical protein|uniref:hypothetical protein n=1 Tax=Hyphobacterium sp. TaxID=2004662 RepID=UPI003BAB7EAA